MASPPKPWERGGGNTSGAQQQWNDKTLEKQTLTRHVGSPSSAAMPSSSTAASSSLTNPPALPERPNTLSSVVNQTASNYSTYNNANRYGASPYGMGGIGGGIGGIGGGIGGGYGGGYSSYSSPYSR